LTCVAELALAHDGFGRPERAGVELADLGEDIRAAWVPDVAGGADFPAFLSGALPGHGPLFQRLEVPKADGGSMKIRVLHPGWHAALHRSVSGLKDKIDAALHPGVFGYRRGADSTTDYSSEWLAFSSHTAEKSQAAKWVVLADVASFFPSLSWIRVAEALAEIDAGATGPLLEVAAEMERGGLDYLPSGYADARLLANAVLNLVDQRIDIPIARWVDDYRLFIPPDVDPTSALDALRGALADIGLSLNEDKTEIVPGARGEEVSKSALTSVYHPERDPPARVRKNLHRLFYESLEDPVLNRRTVRFFLPRLAREEDDVALSFAFHGLTAFPWEAPRLVDYIAAFARRPEVVFLINAHLAAAAEEGNAWLVSRLGVLACNMEISSQTSSALLEGLEELEETPAWGVALRVLSLAENPYVSVIADRPDSPDPRAAMVALRDLNLPLPDHLREAEPVLASALAFAPASRPGTETIL
jgi:hypothetical protein